MKRGMEILVWILFAVAMAGALILAIVTATPAATCQSCTTAQRLQSTPMACPSGQWARGIDVYGNAVGCATPAPLPPPVSTTLSSTTVSPSTTLGVTTTTAVVGPVVTFDRPVIVMGVPNQVNGQVRFGNTIEGPKFACQQGDNEGDCDLVTDGRALADHSGRYSSVRTNAPYGEVGRDRIASYGDVPSLVTYGLPVVNNPTVAPVAVMVPDPAGKFPVNYPFGLSIAFYNQASGGTTAPGPTTCVACAGPGPCRLEVSYTGPWQSPWYGGGTSIAKVWIGSCTDSAGDVFYQWLLDYLWDATDKVVVLDTNGEYATRTDLQMAGYREFEQRDPIDNWAPPWSPGMAVGNGWSMLGPPAAAGLPPLRFEINGVHCDAACRHCQMARGAQAVAAATPPPWRLYDYVDVCDSLGNRYRRSSQTGVGAALWTSPGKCILFGTFGDWRQPGYVPKSAICDGKLVVLP